MIDFDEICNKIANKYNRILPKSGEIYKHFKGHIITVKDIAIDTESLQPVVIYEHNNQLWSRPLEMFLSTVNKTKYPDVKATYRFEKLN